MSANEIFNFETVRLYAQRNTQFSGPFIELYVTDDDRKHHYAKALPLTFQECSQAEFVEPTIKFDKHAAKALMNDLWNMGIRPENWQDDRGQVTAQTAHIADLRNIVGKLL